MGDSIAQTADRYAPPHRHEARARLSGRAHDIRGPVAARMGAGDGCG